MELVPDAIRIFVSDAPAALAFYRDVLGFLPAGGAPELGYLVFKAGAISIIVEASEEGHPLLGRTVGLSFRVQNIHRACQELEQRGVSFTGPPERQAWGGTLAHFYDLERNVFSLV